MLTLAAHTPQRPIHDNLLAHQHRALILVLCLGVYFCYAHAHRIAYRISPQLPRTVSCASWHLFCSASAYR